MNPFSSLHKWCVGLGRVFANELKLITHDAAILLFFVALPLAYPVVYTLIYNPEVVREIPVAVVDDSRTPASRKLVMTASATPAMQIYAYCANMAEAKELMAEGKVYGILQIPHDYGKNLVAGIPANAAFYSDMSLLLRYRAFVAALTDIQIEIIQEVTGEKIASTGLSSLAGGASAPINSESNFLGDTEQGFASFVIPGIVILILQQSMVLGVSTLGGTSRERRRRNGGIDPLEPQGVPVSAQIWGKALAVTVFYIPFTIYVLRFIPEMFNLPHYGSALDYLPFVFPLLLGSAFMGQASVILMKERESPFIFIVFTSVFFLFLSGLTWPRYAMSELWTWVGNCVPATWGVEGFIRINSNAASLADVSREYTALWLLAAAYMVLAYAVTRYIETSARRSAARDANNANQSTSTSSTADGRN